MRRILLLMVLTAVMLLPLTATTQNHASAPTTGAAMSGFRPLTDERLMRAHEESDNWAVYRRTSDQWAFSPLKQVTPENISRLTLAWSANLRPVRNEQEPLVIDGVMFVLHGDAEALDARTGESIWKFRDVEPAPARSLSVYQDRVIFPAHDTRVIGLEARSGRKLWEVQTFPDDVKLTEDYIRNHQWSAGPQVGNGKAFLGAQCMFRTVPCYVAGIDVKAGKLLWRRKGVASSSDPADVQATWEVPVEKRYKGSFWGTGSFDPKTNVTYWGVASATPYPEVLRGGHGDNKWTNSTLAIDTNTGRLKWAFQHLPRDNWDLDNSSGGRIFRDNQRVQPDAGLKWFNPAIKNGATRNVIYSMGKPGIVWALDRDTGEFLWASETLYQDIYKHIDGKGKVTLNEEKIPTRIGQTVDICPSFTGGGNWQFMAYSPLNNALLITEKQICSTLTVDDKNPIGYATKTRPMPGTDGNVGRLVAVDASSGKVLWSNDHSAELYSTMTTAGGLLFVAGSDRNFRAFDVRTGNKLWEIELKGPARGNPISYAVDGRQYIAIVAGGVGGMPALAPSGNLILMALALQDQERRKAPNTR